MSLRAPPRGCSERRADASVLVTGGGRGIGAATAWHCAQQGWAVAVNYTRDAAAAERIVERILAAGGQARALQADVADEAQVLRLFATIDRELPPLIGLVNNAGVVDRPSRVDAMSVARLQRMFAVNVIGSFICAREAVRRMSTLHGGAGGAIVNLSSAAARLGAPRQYVDYAAAKGAIDIFTLGLASEVASEGMRVNAVRPGHHRHRDPRLRRPARPGAADGAAGADAARRQRRRGRAGDRLAALGRCELHDRRDPRRDRRPLKTHALAQRSSRALVASLSARIRRAFGACLPPACRAAQRRSTITGTSCSALRMVSAASKARSRLG